MAKILILHLSDIHIRTGKEKLFERIEQIYRAVQNLDTEAKTCFLVLSGDMSQSGEIAEYELAKSFYNKLKEYLSRSFSRVETIIVPGNHDCYLPKDKEDTLRKLIITQIHSGQEIVLDDGIISTCTKALANFYKFSEIILGKQYPREVGFREEFSLSDGKIVFQCYNTAWMSSRKEIQASLIFPTDSMFEVLDGNSLHVTIFHHPYNWLRADNAKAFRKRIETSSHLILTGHEHEFEFYVKTKHDGKNTNYFEGGVLNETHEPDVSSFNVLLVDSNARQQRFFHFEWAESLYTKYEESDWIPISVNSGIEGEIFRPNETFFEFLVDVGANFKHPRKTLTLPDVFVWPDLKDSSTPSDNRPFTIFKGENLTTYISDRKKVLLVGKDKIGKTTLQRILFCSLSKGYVPLLLKADLLKEPNEEKIRIILKAEFSKQYSEKLAEKYEQLKPSERVLLLDDFHKIHLNLRGKNAILKILNNLYGYIVITSNEDLNLEEMIDIPPEESYLSQFKTFEVMELGYVLREKIIRKWHSLGNEYSLDYEELQTEVRHSHNLITTVLGKNLIPSFPVFTLILLQQIEAGKNTPTANGSFGYMYEFLITEALAQSKFREAEIGTKYSYLSYLAFRLFNGKLYRLDRELFQKIHEQYLKKESLRFSFEGIIEDLIRANILEKKSDGYQFKYRYLYYYFIARYYSRNASEEAIAGSIRLMCSQLYNEDNANIIIFYSYLTQDKAIIAAILNHSRDLYKNYNACDLEKPVEALKKYHKKVEQLEFKIDGAEETRTSVLNQKHSPYESESDDLEVAEAININDAFKTIQIVGQILRSFPGDLGSGLKREMAEECYLLGMRLLSYVITILSEPDSQFIHHIQNVVLAEYKALEASKTAKTGKTHTYRIANKNDLRDRANEFIAQEMHKVTFGIIKRVSDAVGSQYLTLTYDEILAKNRTVSFSLIDASIKLDHARPFPVDHIITLGKEIRKKNMFAYGILRNLTFMNLYLFSRSHQIRQQLCDGLGISLTNNKKIITGSQHKGIK